MFHATRKCLKVFLIYFILEPIKYLSGMLDFWMDKDRQISCNGPIIDRDNFWVISGWT